MDTGLYRLVPAKTPPWPTRVLKMRGILDRRCAPESAQHVGATPYSTLGHNEATQYRHVVVHAAANVSGKRGSHTGFPIQLYCRNRRSRGPKGFHYGQCMGKSRVSFFLLWPIWEINFTNWCSSGSSKWWPGLIYVALVLIVQATTFRPDN